MVDSSQVNLTQTQIRAFIQEFAETDKLNQRTRYGTGTVEAVDEVNQVATVLIGATSVTGIRWLVGNSIQTGRVVILVYNGPSVFILGTLDNDPDLWPKRWQHVNSNQSGIGSTKVAITGSEIEYVSRNPDRLVKCTIESTALSTVANDVLRYYFYYELDGGRVNFDNRFHFLRTTETSMSAWCLLHAPAGDLTFNIETARDTGTGSCSIIASSTSPFAFIVEDWGPYIP